MKLKRVKHETIYGSGSVPTISMAKGGGMQLNQAAQRELHLNEGKHITFFQDEEDQKNWYVEFSGEGELKLRFYEDKGPACSSSHIAKLIKKATRNNPEKGLRALIGKPIKHEDTIVYPLLIKQGSYV